MARCVYLSRSLQFKHFALVTRERLAATQPNAVVACGCSGRVALCPGHSESWCAAAAVLPESRTAYACGWPGTLLPPDSTAAMHLPHGNVLPFGEHHHTQPPSADLHAQYHTSNLRSSAFMASVGALVLPALHLLYCLLCIADRTAGSRATHRCSPRTSRCPRTILPRSWTCCWALRPHTGEVSGSNQAGCILFWMEGSLRGKMLCWPFGVSLDCFFMGALY